MYFVSVYASGRICNGKNKNFILHTQCALNIWCFVWSVKGKVTKKKENSFITPLWRFISCLKHKIKNVDKCSLFAWEGNNETVVLQISKTTKKHHKSLIEVTPKCGVALLWHRNAILKVKVNYNLRLYFYWKDFDTFVSLLQALGKTKRRRRSWKMMETISPALSPPFWAQRCGTRPCRTTAITSSWNTWI